MAMLPDTLALNPQSLDSLRWQAKQDGGKESVRAAAQQFESYFLQMMLRTMRQSLSQDGPFDSRETRMFSDMFDQQVAQSISRSKGLGIADMLVEQLQKQMEAGKSLQAEPRPYNLPPVVPSPAGSKAAPTAATENEPAAIAGDGEPLTPRNFVNKLWPHAVEAAAELGVSPHLLLAQAALETGWGKHQVRTSDGGSSFNLFNIKAGKSWQGERASASTTEHVNGRAVRENAEFRAYGSYGEAFADYARLLKSNPRYAGVLNQDAEGFINGLKQGGYATDPAYGDKLRRIMASATMRQALAA